MTLKSWASGAAGFGKGLAKGGGDFVVSTATGLKDLAVGTYNVVTDDQARAEAWETAKTVAGKAGDLANHVVDNPKQAYEEARNAVTAKVADIQAAHAQAAAEGRLGEFYGEAVGRYGPELIPFGAVTKLGKLSGVAKGAKVLDAAADASKATKVVGAAQKVAPKATTAAAAKVAKATPPKKTPSKPAAKAPAKAGEKPSAKQKAKTTVQGSTSKNKGASGAAEPCPKAAAQAKAKGKGKVTAKSKVPSKKGVNASGKPTQASKGQKKKGEPVNMATGEEMLELEDFFIEGPVELAWTRLYRSGQSGIDMGLGHGWLLPIHQWLEVDDDLVRYHDAEGRQLEWPRPLPGQTLPHPTDPQTLACTDSHLQVSGPDGPDRIFAHRDGRQPLQRFSNPSGQSLHVRYGDDGRPTRLESTWGRAWLLFHDGPHLARVVPALRNAEGGFDPVADALVHYQVDAAGDLIQALDRQGHGEQYRYTHHLLAARTLPSGFAFQFAWDGQSPTARCLRSWGDKGIYDTRFEWLPGGVSRAIDSRGGVTEFVHDDYAQLLQQTTPQGHRTRYRYDAGQRLAAVTDPGGHTTHLRYDERGHLQAVVDAAGQETRVISDAQGRPLAVTDPMGHTWVQRRDEHGRVIEWRDPVGASTQVRYNPMGLPAEVTDALGRKRTLLWDAQARLVGEVGFDGIRSSYQHDAEGRITAVTLQDKRQWRYGYDASGRLVSIMAPDGGTTRMAYDVSGQLIRHIDATGCITEYSYADGLPEPTERRNGLGQALRYAYDTERNLIGLENARGERYRLDWDLDANLVAETGFDGRQQRYAWDEAEQLKAWGQWDGREWRTVRYERDPVGRLLRKLLPDGQAATYTYDAAGRLGTATNEAGTVSRAYDAAGRLVADGLDGQTCRFEYDLLGRRTATTLPDGQRLSNRYGATGTLEETRLGDTVITAHHYDEWGLESQRQQGALATEFGYDIAGRLISQRAQHRATAGAGVSAGAGAGAGDGTRHGGRGAAPAGPAGAVVDRSYRWDPAGRLAEVVDARWGSSRYLYDPAARLARVDGGLPEAFAFDPASNLIGLQSGAGTAPVAARYEGGRLQMAGDRHYRHDAQGNRIEERRGNGGRDLRRYRWDDENRLIEAQVPAGLCTYRYDALGRRVVKTTPQGQTRFVYDGGCVLLEKGPLRTSAYVRPPDDEHRILARVDFDAPGGADGVDTAGAAGARIVHFHLDTTGKPCELTGTDGQLLWSARYRSYGALAAVDTAIVDNPFRLPGQYFDDETELHWSLHRMYDAQSGSFVSQDPIGLDGGSRLQGYPADPVNWVDVWGLSAGCAAKGGTYVLKNAEGTVVKTGRTNNLARREAEHGRNHPDKTFEVDKRTDNRAAQRGREQDLHDANPSAHKANGGMDRINGISPKNPRRDEYLRAGRDLP